MLRVCFLQASSTAEWRQHEEIALDPTPIKVAADVWQLALSPRSVSAFERQLSVGNRNVVRLCGCCSRFVRLSGMSLARYLAYRPLSSPCWHVRVETRTTATPPTG